MNTMIMLVRREFWEHRGLWITPLVVAAVLVLGTLLSPGASVHVDIDGQKLEMLANMSEVRRAQMMGLVVAGLMVPQMIVMLIVVFFYLTDALYGERKDRSILFWKSLPVSDTNTVLSKLLAALVVTPLVVFAISTITGILCLIIIMAKLGGTPMANLFAWDLPLWLRTTGTTLLDMLVAGLWYAPLAAYVLMVSGWAKRSVLLWVVLPPLVVGIAERWYMQSSNFADFIGHRMIGIFKMFDMEEKQAIYIGPSSLDDKMGRMGAMLDRFDLSPALMSAELWGGVLVAAVFVLITIRLRRYRDDTSG